MHIHVSFISLSVALRPGVSYSTLLFYSNATRFYSLRECAGTRQWVKATNSCVSKNCFLSYPHHWHLFSRWQSRYKKPDNVCVGLV